jgi:protein-S-isoprenylcysteine O-methyltransferase Ste14
VATASRSRALSLVPWGDFFFRYRNGIFPVVMVALLVGFRPVYPQGSERLDNWLDLLGVGIALLGQALRVLVIGYVYIIRGGMNKRVYAEELVTEGFFRHSRNPLYVGNLLVLLGLFTIHNNPWVYALGGTFFLFAYSAIVAAEEAYLRRKFGTVYDDYCRRVNRWLPDLRGLRQSIEGMQFAWRRVIIKEYGSTYAWCAGALLLMAYDTLAYFDYEQRWLHLMGLAVVLVILTACWLLIRWLKRSLRLREETETSPTS